MNCRADSWNIAEQVASRVAEAILNRGDIPGVLELCPLAAFLKSRRGIVVYSNKQYDALFAGGVPCFGRPADSFLDKSIQPIASQSDALILLGCPAISFCHSAENVEGYCADMRTTKLSLLKSHHPSIALIGVCEILKRVPRRALAGRKSLDDSWTIYEELSAFDRKLLNQLGTGKSVQDISHSLSVTRKTIETHRKSIFALLGIDNAVQAGHLLCRLQDSGYEEFGI